MVVEQPYPATGHYRHRLCSLSGTPATARLSTSCLPGNRTVIRRASFHRHLHSNYYTQSRGLSFQVISSIAGPNSNLDFDVCLPPASTLSTLTQRSYRAEAKTIQFLILLFTKASCCLVPVLFVRLLHLPRKRSV